MAFDFVVGEAFPAFELPGSRRDEPKRSLVSNKTLLGKPFVLWVFPKVATSGCTLEAREFAALQANFQESGVEVIGLSRDSSSTQLKFCESQELGFPLLSDQGGAWLQEHGLIFEAKMYGKPVTKVARTTFLVDEEGVLRRVWQAVVPLGHGALVLHAAREIALPKRVLERRVSG